MNTVKLRKRSGTIFMYLTNNFIMLKFFEHAKKKKNPDKNLYKVILKIIK